MPKEKKQTMMRAVGMAHLKWKRYSQKEILPYKITLNQLEVLRQLKRKGVLYPTDIANMLFCDRPTATVVIKNMEKKGWVKRQLDSNDFRRFKVSLESAGKNKLKEISWEHPDHKRMKFQPASCFTHQERDQFNKLLTKLNEHLEQVV